MELNTGIGLKMPFLSGNVVDLADLSTINNLTVEDIALSLARENRFMGQTRKGPYSVGQHACLVYDLYNIHPFYGSFDPPNGKSVGKECLHHDDPEAITGDIPSQVKRWLGTFYYVKEGELHNIFNKKFGLKSDVESLADVKYFDSLALHYELEFFTHRYQSRSDLPKKMIKIEDKYSRIWSESETIDAYLERHYRLYG